ncbi:chaperonin 10-like protein, partial [Irpex rosettiformis]
MSSHRAIAIISPGILEEINLPTPSPTNVEVLVEVHYAALMPADVYQADTGRYVQEYPLVIGFTSAGYVKAVGDDVTDLKEGDKVAVIGLSSKSRGLQEFAIAHRSAVAKLPDDYSLAEAVTFPDNYPTAAFTLFGAANLALPLPSTLPASSPPEDADQPILVHGGAATTGQFTIQLFRLTGYTQVYATASPQNHAYLKDLGATKVFDYRSPRLAEEILEATGGAKVSIVVDTVAAIPSIKSYGSLLGKGSRLAILHPIKKGTSIVDVENDSDSEALLPLVQEMVGEATVLPVGAMAGLHKDPLGPIFLPKILPKLLEGKFLRPNRIRLFEASGGPLLERVKAGLSLLRENKVSGEKVVVEV